MWPVIEICVWSRSTRLLVFPCYNPFSRPFQGWSRSQPKLLPAESVVFFENKLLSPNFTRHVRSWAFPGLTSPVFSVRKMAFATCIATRDKKARIMLQSNSPSWTSGSTLIQHDLLVPGFWAGLKCFEKNVALPIRHAWLHALCFPVYQSLQFPCKLTSQVLSWINTIHYSNLQHMSMSSGLTTWTKDKCMSFKMHTTKDKQLHQQSQHSSLCHSLRSGPNGWSPRLAHLLQQMKKLEDYRRLAYLWFRFWVNIMIDLDPNLPASRNGVKSAGVFGKIWPSCLHLADFRKKGVQIRNSWASGISMFDFGKLFRVNRAFAIAEKTLAAIAAWLLRVCAPFMDMLFHFHMQYSLQVDDKM